MQIKTDRLLIEEVTMADALFLMELMNTPTWLQYIGDRKITSQSAAHCYIREVLLASYKKYGYGLYKVSLRKGSEAIGLCGFVKRDYLDCADIGFALLPYHEGQGYAYEASKALMSYGKSDLGFSTVYGITSLFNERSKKLLVKLGMESQKIIHSPDNNEELLLYALG